MRTIRQPREVETFITQHSTAEPRNEQKHFVFGSVINEYPLSDLYFLDRGRNLSREFFLLPRLTIKSSRIVSCTLARNWTAIVFDYLSGAEDIFERKCMCETRRKNTLYPFISEGTWNAWNDLILYHVCVFIRGNRWFISIKCSITID